jgi:hypothetical protein
MDLGRDFARDFKIYERAFIHSRTVLRGSTPLACFGEQFGPKRERTALERLDRVYGAAVGEKECALFMTLLAKTQQGRCPTEITPLEFRAGDSQVLGEARNVSVGHVHKTLLSTAADASGLALKAHGRVYRENRKLSTTQIQARTATHQTGVLLDSSRSNRATWIKSE